MSRFAKSILIVGAGGHSRVVRELAHNLDYTVVGFVEKSDKISEPIVDQLTIYSEEELLNSELVASYLTNGVPRTSTRLIPISELEELQTIGYSPVTLIAPNAVIAESAIVNKGVQVFPGAIVQSHSRLGDWVLINSGAIIEHDVEIGGGTHVAPGAIICGGVTVGSNCFIGAGSVLREGISIAKNTIVGAGAVVTKNIPVSGVVAGNPARRLEKET